MKGGVNMNIFYEKPKDYNGCNYGVKTDVNGNTIWIDWSAWISCIKIDSEENTKLLPPEIRNYVDKWERELLKKKDENFSAPYEWDLTPPKIYFIFNDNVYCLYPAAFKTGNYHYFYGIKDVIERDLVEAGSIFTWYID